MNPEQIIYQRVPRATLLFQKFCDLESSCQWELTRGGR
jgi:hypothetical protein